MTAPVREEYLVRIGGRSSTGRGTLELSGEEGAP